MHGNGSHHGGAGVKTERVFRDELNRHLAVCRCGCSLVPYTTQQSSTGVSTLVEVWLFLTLPTTTKSQRGVVEVV